MPNYKLGIALFTTENITAILRSIPDSNDTYADIARQARGHGAIVSPRTISRWVNVGRGRHSGPQEQHGLRAVRQAVRRTAPPNTAGRTPSEKENSPGHWNSWKEYASAATTRC